MRVAVIDDDADTLRVLEEILTVEGYTVRAFTDPEQALKEIPDFFPRAILLDVVMPKIDGAELARRFQEHPDTANVPLILLTGLQSAAGPSRAWGHAIHAVIAKPVHSEELLKILREAIESKM